MNDILMESGLLVSSIMAIVLLAAMITFAIFSGKLELFKNKKTLNQHHKYTYGYK